MGFALRSVIPCVAASFMGASAAIAEPPAPQSPVSTPNLIQVDSRATRNADARQIIVGMSVVLVIDTSSSVDRHENARMMEGIKAAVRDEQNLNYSDCYALTVVKFGSRARMGATHIACGRDSAERFISSELAYNPDLPAHQQNGGLGIYTNVEAGLREAASVFAHERATMQIYAMQRRMVIMGDGPANSGKKELLGEVTMLARQYGVTTYAIPIADVSDATRTANTETYFAAQLLTPAGIDCVDSDVWGSAPRPIQPGQFVPAQDFSDVQRGVTLAMVGPGL